MGKIKVVSFDLEGTLVTPDFSQAVWYEGIPALYSERNQIGLEQARAMVEREYREIGDQRMEWYDIKYWFQHFHLEDYQRVLEDHKHKLCWYPEVMPVLSFLGRKYTLVVISSTTREFFRYMLADIERYLARAFSSISDYGQLKNPAFYLTVCREMNILPEEVAHIGDSWRFDFLAARKAGIKALHLNRDGKSEEERSLTNLTDLEARLLSD
jgi:putative hydrolase of the HAD superfamily